MIKVSLFASSIRPHLYEYFFKSLEGTSVEYEVVFAGNSDLDILKNFVHNFYLDQQENTYHWSYPLLDYYNCKYIKTANIKPAQCYEITRRNCVGEVVIWVADDCEFPNDVIGKAYRFYKEKCGYKDIVSIQSRENYGIWQMCDITHHKFFSASAGAPKMAPLGMINREYFQELGGIDRRFISGQWDNELLMRVYKDGGNLHHFSDAYIELDHINKHDPKFGISAERPFGQGYAHDRRVLEGAWGQRGQMKYSEFPNFTRYDEGFEPYESETILTKSESFNIERLFSD